MGVKKVAKADDTYMDKLLRKPLVSTFKGRVVYPEYFRTIDASIKYTEDFVEWYNYHHQHSSIDYLRPYEVHEGLHGKILEHRKNYLKLIEYPILAVTEPLERLIRFQTK